MSLTPAKARLIYEPSGELRLQVTQPRKDAPAKDPLKRGSLSSARSALSTKAKISENIRCIRSGRGSMPRAVSFTRYARRQLKNAVAALKHSCRRRIVFITITLPGSTDDAFLTLARYSAQFVDTLYHWIRHHCPTARWVYKWEWQSRGALHLHAALGSLEAKGLVTIQSALKQHVYKMLCDLSDKTGNDLFDRGDGTSWRGSPDVIQCQALTVRKCIKRYMAKYIAKEPGEALGYFPSRWFGMSQALRHEMASLRRACTRVARSTIEALDLAQKTKTVIQRFAPYMVAFGNPIYFDDVTFVFWLDDEHREKAWQCALTVFENLSIVEPPRTQNALTPEWWHLHD